MAEINISNEHKIQVMRTAYHTLIMTFSTYCYHKGIDPFAVDIDTFEPPDSTDPSAPSSSEAINNTVTSIRRMNAQFAELGVDPLP